jgi:hypothetical protein
VSKSKREAKAPNGSVDFLFGLTEDHEICLRTLISECVFDRAKLRKASGITPSPFLDCRFTAKTGEIVPLVTAQTHLKDEQATLLPLF